METILKVVLILLALSVLSAMGYFIYNVKKDWVKIRLSLYLYKNMKWFKIDHDFSWVDDSCIIKWTSGKGSVMLYPDMAVCYHKGSRVQLDFYKGMLITQYFIGRLRNNLLRLEKYDREELQLILNTKKQYDTIRSEYDNDRSRNKPKIKRHH